LHPSLSRTHPRQCHRREAVPRELRLLARIAVTLAREDPRGREGAHPHAIADEEDDPARHPRRRHSAGDAGAQGCRPDPRLDRPRRRFIPNLPLCEQNKCPITGLRNGGSTAARLR